MSNEEAHAVIHALRKFRDDIDEICRPLETTKWVDLLEKERLQELLRSLRASLKQAAKHGTVDGTSRPQTHYEDAYFEPAVSGASANLRVAVNSHPNKSNWHSNLYGIRIDITYYLHQLEQQFPDA